MGGMSLANMFSMAPKSGFWINRPHIHQANAQANLNNDDDDEEEEHEEEEPNFYNSKCKANEYIKILDEKIYEELKMIDEIALRTSGKVLKVSYNNKIYALKIMNYRKSSPNNYSDNQNFIKEYEFLSSLNHPNILKTFGIFLGNERKPPALLSEFCQMNLDELMKSKELSKFEIVCLIYQIIEAMKYLNFKKIIHLNLKPSNILIQNNIRVKIGDFRISQSTNHDYHIKSHEIGELNFNAPEIFNGDYNEKSDVYSFGILLFYILSNGNLPNRNIIEMTMGKKVEIPDYFTQFSKDLINKCWNFDPKDRPSFKDILDELMVKKYDLVDLNDSELQKVESFVKKKKKIIPPYEE